MSRLEDLLSEAMSDGAALARPADDLFSRIQTGIESDRQRRSVRRRTAVAVSAGVVGTTTLLAVIFTNKGETAMDWWIFELIGLAILIAIALLLGPFIKRFGRSYAADVFRSNPSTGKSFIVLTDFAYYLIFTAYILFTTKVERAGSWSENVGAEQVQNGVLRLGGILLIIGVLHGINLVLLPVIGRLLTLNRRLDQQMREAAERDLHSPD